MSEQRVSGVVKFFDYKKGWGFISVQGEADVFVHVSDLKGVEIDEGDNVTFVKAIGKSDKGPKAIGVKVER